MKIVEDGPRPAGPPGPGSAEAGRASSAADPDSDGSRDSDSLSEAASAVLAELRALVRGWLELARIERALLGARARRAALWAVLGVIALGALFGLTLFAMGALIVGLAAGLAAWFDSVWLGSLAAGLGVLAVLALGVLFGARRIEARQIAKHASRERARAREEGHP